MNICSTRNPARTAAMRVHRSGILAVVALMTGATPAFATNGYFAHGYFSLFGAMLAELFPTRIRASAQRRLTAVGRDSASTSSAAS